MSLLRDQCVQPSSGSGIRRDGETGRGGYYGSGSSDAQQGRSASNVLCPQNRGGFHGSAAQSAHVEQVRRATRAAAVSSPPHDTDEIAVRNPNLGLEALKEKKRQEDLERAAKRETARLKRQGEERKKEQEDEDALAECERQARQDVEVTKDGPQGGRVTYEGALIVRIAVHFGTAGVWTKIAEARSRGADIPLDPKRIYLLAHPDKCRLAEASDATAILNAQRPPEMVEASAKPTGRSSRLEEHPVTPAVAVPSPRSAPGVVAHSLPTAAATETGSAAEKRKDPDDGVLRTFAEIKELYKGTYSDEELEAYWRDDCTPIPKYNRRRG